MNAKTRQRPAALSTRICKLFGVDYPIVQTGMGWVSGAGLTAATSGAGGLGILASVTMTFPELEAAIHKVKSRTDNPFGVNLRADQADVDQRVDLMIREGVKVASFAGPPSKPVVARLKDAGILTIPTIGAVKHAVKMQKWGCDAVIAQGHEGGGHTGPVPTTLLLPAVCKAVDIPVLGAGGFKDGRGLAAALAYGAEGIAMGTRFLLTRESGVPDHVKAKYIEARVTDTVVTTSIDGWPQRVIRTPLIDRLERALPGVGFVRAAMNGLRFQRQTGERVVDLLKEALAMKKSQELTWTQTAMAPNAPMMTKAAMVDGDLSAGILPTGQITGMIDELPAVADVLEAVMDEAADAIRRLCGEES